MSIKEICLENIELPYYLKDEGISSLLHTILFVRAPLNITPIDQHCKSLAPLIYSKCGNQTIDDDVA